MKSLRLAIAAAVLLVSVRTGAKEATALVAGVGGDEPAPVRAFVFQVDVPAVSATPEADGSVKIAIPGYRARETRIGAPDLAATVYRVAIPPGVIPRLEARILAEDFLAGTRPRPVPRFRFDVEGDPGADEASIFNTLSAPATRGVARHDRFEEDASIYAGDATWPPTVARLGEIGIFRDQRYVTVTVSPARFDPSAGGVRVARKIEIKVHLDGDTGARSAPRTDPQFESIYREMFVNYAEGMTFRLGAAGSLSDLPPPRATLFDGPSYDGPVYKIKIRQNRTIRLNTALLTGTGFLEQPMSTWKLTSRGVEAPLRINDLNSNDLMDGADWVQFWGQALDDEPDPTLHTDVLGDPIDIFQARDFTDENIYFLSIESGVRLRMTTRDSAPTFSRPVETTFEGVARAEVDNQWRPLASNDPWYWGPNLNSNAVLPNVKERTDVVALPGLASTTSPIRVVTLVRGLSESSTLPSADHHSQVTLMNAGSQPLLVDDRTFDGRIVYTHDFTWPGAPSTASDPVRIRLRSEPIAAGSHDMMLDRIEIHYSRSFQAFGDVLEFSRLDGDAEFIVTGLTSPPEAWELTQQTNGISVPVRLTGVTITGPGACPSPPGGANCYTARLRVDDDVDIPNNQVRRFVVFGSGAIAIPPAPADFGVDTQSDLLSTNNQANLIVIADSGVLGAACQPVLDDLLDWRLTNQGLTSKVVSLGDIYDEFNNGLPGPQGIKNFLEYVMTANPDEGWMLPKPAYVLLLGDGSYDYKAGTTNGNIIPTQVMFKDDPTFGYYASDSYLAAVVGPDQMPDLAIGRVPVRSDPECEDVLGKILGYQNAPPTGNWRRHALVISDRGKNLNDVQEALDYEAMNDSALATMKRPPHTTRRLRYWTDYCGGNGAGCTCPATNLLRNHIKAAVNGTDGQSDGVSIMQFIGHGNFDIWSNDSFFDNGCTAANPTCDIPGGRTSCDPNGERDSAGLDNPGKLPILFVHNCLSNGLPPPAHTLGRDMIKKFDGGVVALFSPSGLTNGYFTEFASDFIWKGFFGQKKQRILADPIMSVYSDLCLNNAFEACQNYLLFGDPATRAVFPTVAPATMIVAAPGNTRVDLSWTASTTPGARYDIYRAAGSPTAPTGTFTRINGLTPVNAMTYADLGLTNAQNYYYSVVAVDGELFESRWSHFNSDCPVNGPDCLRAKPLNPNPPATPTGLTVVDPETGGKLIVSWTGIVDSELKRYEVRYGDVQGGPHPIVVNAALFTSVAVSGLISGHPYYFVVRAINTSDVPSPDSPEVSGTPTFVRGLRAPQFISALHVDKSGTDALLSWPAVTHDIYGKATTIARYEIYRGTTPAFMPGPGNKIGEPTSTSFPDDDALLAGVSYHYLVCAVDTQGSKGGLGNQLPNGIGGLSVNKSVTPGKIVLSWPAVTNNFDLGGIVIDHYEIYARSTPFRMADVRDGLIQMIHSTSALSYDFTPDPDKQHYSVVGVDAKGNKSPF